MRQDWELDRIYLPAEDLERFGVTAGEIDRREPSPGFAGSWSSRSPARASSFATARPPREAVSPRVRRGMLMARSVYGAVLDRTEHLNFDVLRHRTDLPPWRLAEAVAQGLRARA